MKRILATLLTSLLVFSCAYAVENGLSDELGLTTDAKPASGYTVEVNSSVYSLLDFEDTSEYDNAVRGLIDAPEVLELKDADGKVVWSQAAYSFLNDYEKAPDTVNPSLWENTRNNHAYGLFEVCEGIYQVRGYDMSNLTVVKGDTGWILFDPLMSIECSQAAMQLIEKNLGSYPVKAVIISHPHADHFGGILGVMKEEDAADASLSIEEQLASGKIPVIVPEGFAEHAIAENVYAGKAMTRRANYQYGVLLTPGVTGKMAQGIGMGQSTGTVSYLAPTYEIKTTGETLVIDGIKMEFQMTPGTEAPAEMNTWFPQFKALWVAEITNTIVYADPTNEAARLLCADALEQLGYQAESGPWRNAYLTAALELRYGNQALNAAQTKSSGFALQMTAEMMFDYMGIIMDKDALAEKDFTINVTLNDVNEQHVLHVKNGVLLVYEDTQRTDADASITCPKNALFYILTNNSQGLAAIPMEGDAALITLLAGSMNQFPVQGIMPFNIIEP